MRSYREDIKPLAGKTMRALWLENQSLSLKTDLEMSEAAQDQVLIKVLLAGVCGTDLELCRGYYPFSGIPGHEFVGRVVSGPGEWSGKRVVAEINLGCGQCQRCQRGEQRHCARRRVVGIKNYPGAFADYLVLPISVLHQVPDTLSDEQAVFTEPLAAALQIQKQVDIGPHDRVLVVGAGRLGQLVARSLALKTDQLWVTARNSTKLDMLARRGIRVLQSSALGQSGQTDFDIAVECSGQADGFELARKALRPCGTLVVKSTYAGDLCHNMSALVVDEISVIGSRCGPFDEALALLQQRDLGLDELITARFGLTDAVSALQTAAQPGQLKVLIAAADDQS